MECTGGAHPDAKAGAHGAVHAPGARLEALENSQ